MVVHVDFVKTTVRNSSATMGGDQPLSKQEQATVSAICNRIMRVLGLQDRDGVQRDLAIVQANCPIDLNALVAASELVLMDELLAIVDATDRTTGSLKGNFNSRFMLGAQSHQLV